MGLNRRGRFYVRRGRSLVQVFAGWFFRLQGPSGAIHPHTYCSYIPPHTYCSKENHIRSGCSRICPAVSWILPRMKTPLWASFSIWPLSLAIFFFSIYMNRLSNVPVYVHCFSSYCCTSWGKFLLYFSVSFGWAVVDKKSPLNLLFYLVNWTISFSLPMHDLHSKACSGLTLVCQYLSCNGKPQTGHSIPDVVSQRSDHFIWHSDYTFTTTAMGMVGLLCCMSTWLSQVYSVVKKTIRYFSIELLPI